MTVDDYLRSVGKKCFIDNYEIFQDLNLDRQFLINKFKKENLSLASCDTKASDGRQIFLKNLEIDALKNILNSKRLDRTVKDKAKKLLKNNLETIIYPDEVEDSNLYEGTKKLITVNAYERSTQARGECIKYYGYKCQVCNFNFEKVYGNIGKDFIHVHHIVDISTIGENYQVNPIKDLIPVCPNCHAMLHKRKPAYTPKEIKSKILEKNL